MASVTSATSSSNPARTISKPRQQSLPRNHTQQQQHSVIHQHQPFPSSTSSFSFRNSTYSSSSFLGPNDSTRLSLFQQGTSAESNGSNGSSSSYFNFSGQSHYQHGPAPPLISTSSFTGRRTTAARNHNYSFIDNATPASFAYGTGTGTGADTAVQQQQQKYSSTTFTGTARGGHSSHLMKPRATTVHEPLLHYQGDSESEINSLYTIDHHSTTVPVAALAEHELDYHRHEIEGNDRLSYFGSAGQDYMLKQKRARRSKLICWVDLIVLIMFTLLLGWNPEDRILEWDWVSLSLTAMAIARISVMLFTVRYRDGNYNTAVIFVCVLITLLILFEINRLIQQRVALTMTLIAQYSFSIVLTQLHWISYSAHTPMSAILEYYDPHLSDSITFSRESRHINAFPPSATSTHHSRLSLRRGTSYGTMVNSPFDAVQELDEEQDGEDEDQDVFIKVDIDRNKSMTSRQGLGSATGIDGSSSNSSRNSASGSGRRASQEANRGYSGLRDEYSIVRSQYNDDDGNDEAEENDEEQDMATLLAFQDARRQQVLAFSPTASSAVIPARSILSSPQALPVDSSSLSRHRMPLSWAYQGRQSGGSGIGGSYASSYDMRIAAANASSSATAAAGGLTIGYTPRKRLMRSNMGPNGTGRRTWTGGHNIIYSGIFVEDSDEDEIEQSGQTDGGKADASTMLEDDEEEDQRKHLELDDTIKVEVNIIEGKTLDETAEIEEQPSSENVRIAVEQGTIVTAIATVMKDQEISPIDLDRTDITVAVVALEENDLKASRSQPQAQSQEAICEPQTPDTMIDVAATEAKASNTFEGIEEDHEDIKHHPHVLSTLKLHLSSHKDITAVMCEEDNCSEHQFQEGPAAELEAILGPEFHSGNIINLDIKENSTVAVERTGDGINPEFITYPIEGPVNEIHGIVIPDCIETTLSPLPLLPQTPSSIIETKIEDLEPELKKGGDEHDHGQRDSRYHKEGLDCKEVEKIEQVEQTEQEPSEGIGSTLNILLPEVDPDNSRRQESDAVMGEEQQSDKDKENRIHERTKQIMVEKGDNNEIIRPAVSDSNVIGDVVVFDSSSNTATTIITGPRRRPHPTIPGQWIEIDDMRPPEGVITWGIVDDIPPSLQDDIPIEPNPGPAVYIPPQRTAIVEPPRPIAVTTPEQVVIPPAYPIVQTPEPMSGIFQPQPHILPQPRVIQRPPLPMVYTPPSRPIIAPPPQRMLPLPPMTQQRPVVVAPPQQPIIQPAPQMIASQPQIVASAAPIGPMVSTTQPAYGTYETIVPGAPQGVGMRGPSGSAAPVTQRYSVASIYDDDVYSVASIYDHRSVASIHELEGHATGMVMPATALGIGAGAAVGTMAAAAVEQQQPWLRSTQPLPENAYSHQFSSRPLTSGAHAFIQEPSVEMQARHLQRAQEARDVFTEGKSDIHMHLYDSASNLPEYQAEDMGEYSRRIISASTNAIDTVIMMERSNMDVDEHDLRASAAARHAAFPSDSANTEVSYQELQLQGGMPVMSPLQEMSLETYYDTTKSQMKVREQQGQLLSEMAQQLKKRQLRIQQMEREDDELREQQRVQERESQRVTIEMQKNEVKQEQVQHTHPEEQQPPRPETEEKELCKLPSPSMSGRIATLPSTTTLPISGSLLMSPPRTLLEHQQQLQQQPQPQPPPTLNFPKPPLSPPPVRLLATRGLKIGPSSSQTRTASALSSQRNRVHAKNGVDSNITRKDSVDSHLDLVILSTSARNAENIMLQDRSQTSNPITTEAQEILVGKEDAAKATFRVRSLITESVFSTSAISINTATTASTTRDAAEKLPSPDPRMKVKDTIAVSTASSSPGQRIGMAATSKKSKRKQDIPPSSRHHLHPLLLQEGIMACWNNEFGTALNIFKEYEGAYPRWSLAAAEVHIVRQLISGQLSEADSELMDALQLSEKVASRVLDRRQEFDASFMAYKSVCSTDATLATANDNSLRQNYKWDCEMTFYDTLLYRGVLQLTSASDTKGTFSDIKGGLQLRRAWKGYLRIKQEMEMAKEKWQKLSTLVQAKIEQEHKTQKMMTGEEDVGNNDEIDLPITKASRPTRLSKTQTMPIPIPTATKTQGLTASPSSKKSAPLSTSHTSDGGSRWSLFGKRSSWNQSAASLSSSPPVDNSSFDLLHDGERLPGSRFLASSPSTAKGLASLLRDQTKAVEEIKTAVKVLEDVEDYMHYGIGLFYFIVSIVPKSLLPALRTIGLQANHEQAIKNLELVSSNKNGRAPFAALFLLINYLFLPRGMNDPCISLGRAGEIVEESLKTCPNGSSYLLMACHHARKTGNIIPAALNHITRGIQTCEAAGIPSINYRFELGLTFFVNQEFGKAADIFEILWRRFIATISDGSTENTAGGGLGRRTKGRSQGMSQATRTDTSSGVINFGLGHAAGPGPGRGFTPEEDEEEDDFELAPFCGLCLIASKTIIRQGQDGYFGYGRDGFGHHISSSDKNSMSAGNGDGGSSSTMMSSSSGLFFDSTVSGSTMPLHLSRPGPDFDLLMAAQEVLIVMSGADQLSSRQPEGAENSTPIASIRSRSGSIGADADAGLSGNTILEHSKAGSTHSTASSHLLSSPVPTQAGKLNRFNKFAWNQCQKSLQRGRISPFLPLVILYLRRDLAYMKPVLLRKYRTLLETIWKSAQHTADADTQAIYLLLSAVVHRQLLPDDATFAYTALTDCLLLESAIESEMWVVPHCHYELGELLYKRLHLSQAALEQFQWIVKGPGKEARPASIFYAASPTSASNPRLSVFGGGFPSDIVTNIVESAAAQAATHSNQPSTSSNHRLSQLFSSNHARAASVTNPPNPMTFYNSRYKKFEFSQALRHRSSICVEQIQKEIEDGSASGPSSSVLVNRRTSVSTANEQKQQQSATSMDEEAHGDTSRKRHSSQAVEPTDDGTDTGSKSARVSTGQSLQQHGWGSSNTMPNILSDAQRKRGSQQWGFGKQVLKSNKSTSGAK
ncbi:hypothetical protein BX616_003629 [Lobosporangium transversale]|nr:hypothetical protein BX616_003629 [Lobosporangium transversale]